MVGRSAPHAYDVPTIVLHWALAAAIPVALVLGFLAAHAPDSRQAASLLRAHVPLGIAILLLSIARAVWRYRRTPPAPLAGQPDWQIGVARGSHALLYIMPMVLGASGIALLALSGAAPVLFQRAGRELPVFTHFPAMTVHALSAFVLIGLLGLHVAAVIYHQVFRRDRLLSRMGLGSPELP